MNPVHRTFWLCYLTTWLAIASTNIIVISDDNNEIVSLACDDNVDNMVNWDSINDRLIEIKSNLTDAEYWFDSNNITHAHFQWVKLGFNVIRGVIDRREIENVLMIRDNLCNMIQMEGFQKEVLDNSLEYLAGIELQGLLNGLLESLEQSVSVLSQIAYLGKSDDLGASSISSSKLFSKLFSYLNSQIVDLAQKRDAIKKLNDQGYEPREVFQYLNVVAEQALFDVIYTRAALITVFERMQFCFPNDARTSFYSCLLLAYLIIIYLLIYITYVYLYRREVVSLRYIQPHAHGYIPF